MISRFKRASSAAGGDGPRLAAQFTRFLIVGGLNTFVDLLVLNLLIWAFQDGRDGLLYAAFKTAAFMVAVTNSYVLNRLWTFEARHKQVAGTLLPFLAISLVGLVLNVGTAYLFVEWFPPPASFLVAVWPSVASLVGTAAGLAWNFVGYRTLVFNRTAAPLPEEAPVAVGAPERPAAEPSA